VSGFAVAVGSRATRVLAVSCCGLAVMMAGCSGGKGASQARFSSVSAEPELAGRPAASVLGRRYRRLVPVVIAAPQPFRVASLSTAGASLASAAVPMPLGRAGDDAIRLVSGTEPLAEPRPLPGLPATGRPAVAAIGAMLADYRQAFNRHDAEAAAAHWADSCENMDLDSGRRTTGREAVRGIFAELFELDHGASLDIDIDTIRSLRDDVAVVDGISRVAYEDGSVAGSRFSAVVVREGDRWLLSTVREAETATASRPAGPLEELAWLVGSWENVGSGVTASSDCSWAPGRRFLIRSHLVIPDTATATPPRAGDTAIPALLPPVATGRQQLTEVIGWDPERQTVRSWIFSADGRFAEASWSRQEAGWLVRIDGQGTDTGRAATLRLEPDGSDGFTLSSEAAGGALAGLCPPACSFTRTAR
jgi:uncharacterized protein (TIGR02246 family)